MNTGIYQIRCIVTGRIYIGSALDLKTRWSLHRSRLRRGIHPNRSLQAAWLKYGKPLFVFEILEYVTVADDLVAREQHWLDTLRPFRRRGYNVRIEASSNLGITMPNGTGQKISSANKGRVCSPETRAKIAAAHRGMKHSPETCAKMSLARKNPSPEVRARLRAQRLAQKDSPETIEKRAAKMRGYKHTEEAKAKISAWHKGRKFG